MRLDQSGTLENAMLGDKVRPTDESKPAVERYWRVDFSGTAVRVYASSQDEAEDMVREMWPDNEVVNIEIGDSEPE